MNIDLTKRWLAHFEARRAVAYDDHNGRPLLPGIQPIGCPTIGIGCNLLTASARTEIKTLGLDYSRVVSGMLELNDDQIDHLLNIDLDQAIRTARLLVPSLDQLLPGG